MLAQCRSHPIQKQCEPTLLGTSPCGESVFLTSRQPPPLDPDMGVLAAGYNADALAEAKVYIAHLLVSRVTVSLSFLPADWRPPGGAADPSSGGAPCMGPLDLTLPLRQMYFPFG